MPRRHPETPTAWLITDPRLDAELLAIIRRLPRGSGVLVRHHHLGPGERARLLRRIRRGAAGRQLVVVDETQGRTARVHSAREIARARLQGARWLLVSPVFPTRSHPDWRPLPRMKAAALVRLAGHAAVALGGMDVHRFRQVAPLGFAGWAGIDGWPMRKKPSGK
ncbi:thiamine phosphate synthase [Sphingomonas sp. GCM10030256]|uniref:thiamine phosphate synthase n=1 Tax=Sphingomonas sp. GCM10030256 TaxID=3273427 RepID=UPI00361B61DD